MDFGFVCYLSFGAWNLLDSRTLLDLDSQFDFFNIILRYDTSSLYKASLIINYPRSLFPARPENPVLIQ